MTFSIILFNSHLFKNEDYDKKHGPVHMLLLLFLIYW
jgi:hypothetical protein